jgi:hypothetical protein
MVASLTTLQLMLGIAHGEFRLLGHGNHFKPLKLQTNSYCADVASKDSLELSSEC